MRIVGETVCKGHGAGKSGAVARTISVGGGFLLFFAKRQCNQALSVAVCLCVSFFFEKHDCRAFRPKSATKAKNVHIADFSCFWSKYAYEKTKVILAYARKLLQMRAFCGIIAL